MPKLTAICAVAVLVGASLAWAGQNDMAKSGSWSGVIVNSDCTADEAFAESAKCVQNVPGGKLSLYDDTIRQVYSLEPQDPAAGHLGDSVTVQGRLEATTIQVASLEVHTDIGLPVGQKAPGFSLRDQFGREHSLESLKGPKGTVLLFFRSADW
jgi:hypothetical protein